MTQSFTFQESVSDLGQGVLSGANMMPPWKQAPTYNFLPNDAAMVEKHGQKRRRSENELTQGVMPNERDSVQRHPSGATAGDNLFYELSAGQTAERESFLAKMKHSAVSGRFPLTGSGVVANNPVNYQPSLNVVDSNATHAANAARYRLSQRPVTMSLDAAAAATAQAMANFQALIDEGRRSLNQFQATNGFGIGTNQGYSSTPFRSAERSRQQQHQVQSNYGSFGAPSFRATGNHASSDVGNQSGFDNLFGFGASFNTNRHRRVDVNGAGGDASFNTNGHRGVDINGAGGEASFNTNGHRGVDVNGAGGEASFNSNGHRGVEVYGAGGEASFNTNGHRRVEVNSAGGDVSFDTNGHRRVEVNSAGGDASFNINGHRGVEVHGAGGEASFNTNGHKRVDVNGAGGDANWPNLSCQVSASNASRSFLETNPVGESESPRTPRGHQGIQNTIISGVHQEYLRHEERLNAFATDPESPRQNSTRGRRLSYAAPQERPPSDYSIFHGYEPIPADNHIQGENHIHIYLDPVEFPKHVDDWTSASTHVDVSQALPEQTGFSVGGVGDVVEGHGQQEIFSQSFESAPVVAPAESHFGSGEKFDLNEVPVGVGETATPKPARKKYHPRVQKDKRTYKRRVDGKKVPASPVDAFTNSNSPAKKIGKRSANQAQYESTNDEGRDASHPEVVDMDIDDNGNIHRANSQHDTTVCDCEACIKVRLEKRSTPQSPVSPPQRQSWCQTTSPPVDSDSPSVRRNLFQGSSAQAPVPEGDLGSGPPARRSLSCFDTSDDVVIPQQNAYSTVKSFFSTSRSATSCLQQFTESAAQLGLTNSFSSPIVPANPAPTNDSSNNRASGIHSNNSHLSLLCPRKIIAPNQREFRGMTQIQRSLYLRSILRANHQFKMSPETLLKHVHDHLPEEEKVEFKEAIWPIVVAELTDDQEGQLKRYAESELKAQEKAESAVPKVAKQRGLGKVKKLSKEKELAMTLWSDGSQAMKSNSKAGRKKKSTGGAGASGNGIISQNGLEMVPYVDKAVVPYTGAFDPLKKKKNRAKVVLDDETMNEWKIQMSKPANREKNESDAAKELKWEEERRKMKALTENFIQRMHIVMGDRSFSKWKGSVVDSVVGAFLTQNVNDVLSSSAFMSMRSRYPGPGSHMPSAAAAVPEEAAAAPEEAAAQSFIQQQTSSPFAPSPPIQPQCSATPEASSSPAPAQSSIQQQTSPPFAPSPPMQPQCSATPEASSSSAQQPSPPQEVTVPQPTSEGPPPTSVTVLESQESRNRESYEFLHKEVAASTCEEQQPGTVLDLQSCQKEDSKTSNSVLTDELSTGENQAGGVVSAEIELTREFTTDPSHGKFNPKTGLTGLERAQIEEKQVSARKHFDFSELPPEFAPGQNRPPPPPRTEATQDGVDWEAVRLANVAEVADVIKERGLNWILAGRIKAFLERMHKDYGGLDLEWLRSMSTDQTKDFLLSIHGLGLKSVECIRLLTLHHLAFPVDTNVGRICVRLGWVPLEPLPEELQLHLLELYPVQATIQKYLWPRLCKFDHKTLYELHYQMISFGKVFCTKTKPNCNACPMRPECKHFASALSTAKLALPAPVQSSNVPILALPTSEVKDRESSRLLLQYECEPIIEEPMTPELEADIEDLDIEDYPFTVEELIEEDKLIETMYTSQTCSPSQVSEPTLEPVLEVLQTSTEDSTIVEGWGGLATTSSTSKVVSSSNVIEVVDSTDNLEHLESPSVLVPTSASQEMVLLAPSSLPVPKLKNVSRLRTVHYVYELPDNHPLLDEMDPREGDDPCTYLLAIWGPEEVPESIPNMNDSMDEENGPSSNLEGKETIKATLLVPCRTAMRGSFPLNGTYFQVNEVFADHASSLTPILVPRTLLWNLRRRFVFFGTSVISIFRGMTAAEIQACFWRGYVCVRGFERSTRAPKPLVGRLHLQAGKAKGVNVDG